MDLSQSKVATAASNSVIQRVVAVLEILAREGEHVSLSMIAARADLPKPTAYRLLRMLADAGWAYRERNGAKGFSAGPRLERLALDLVQHGGSRAARHAALTRLVAELGETCNVTALAGAEVLYLDRVESNSPLRAHLEPGSRVPVYCTASGKLFLSGLSKVRRERLYDQIQFKQFTERTFTDRGSLEAELARIRHNGYAVDNEEYVGGLLCVAVPVIGSNGRTFAAVAVQAPVGRLPLAKVTDTLPALRRAAEEIAIAYERRSREQQSWVASE